jgi:2-polyprenyl-3-methyl-5-hydroxy-6-metoxy-1,4-benzoquinol methylase
LRLSGLEQFSEGKMKQTTLDEARIALDRFESAMTRIAPFMVPSFRRQRELFGADWDRRFGETIAIFVADTADNLDAAIRGYVNFAIDGMRLQKRFEKTRRYDSKSYDEAAKTIYHNESHMLGLYLPGILLSHYLWPHHYRQLQFFERSFLPSFLAAPHRTFCDIGPGTGFYSRQLLASAPDAIGRGFDISRSALLYSQRQMAAFGLADRWNVQSRDVILEPPEHRWPFLVCIEVLEHLEDPLTFLKALRRILAEPGRGMISAAVTAPNEDHIYLYNSADEVRAQLEEAGFSVLQTQVDRAYEPKGDQPVPTNVAFIVS